MTQEHSWMKKVEEVAQGAAQNNSCVLYDIEFVGVGAGRTLRVYIDKEGEGGPSLDDCSNVSRFLNEYLDTNDIIPGEAYQLEVSSPGVDRHLKFPWHFQKVVGKKIYLKTKQPLEAMGVTDKKWMKTKTVEEVLSSADENMLSFKVKNAEFNIPYNMIEKAKLVFEMVKGQKK